MKTKNYSFSKNLFKLTTVWGLFLLFVGFQFFQYHHTEPTHKVSSSKTASISEKCNICEFVTNKQNSFTLTNPPSSLEVFLQETTLNYFFQELTWENIDGNYPTNKGPPVAA